MFEFRLRILHARERETDTFSYLGIDEGIPDNLVHTTSVEQAEIDLVNALTEHLERLLDHDSSRLQLDDMPTVRSFRLHLTRGA